MHECLTLAQQAEAFVAPNPMVGCIIVHNNNIVSRGFHQKFGGAHAEVNAINAMPLELSPSECELYVNLEPCSHQGKTPPCADLIINKGFRKVFIGSTDPNPLVKGSGIDKLKNANIEVIEGLLEKESIFLNRKFYCFHHKKRPYVTLKWAETKDGFIGRHLNQSHLSSQISNIECRPYVHSLRAHNMAILIGANTANRDNPLLTLRFHEGNNPIKVLLSKNNTVESDLQLFKEGKCIVYNALKESTSEHVEFVKLPHRAFVQAMLTDLYERNIQSILVEGGAQVLQTFIDHRYWDEVVKIVSDSNWGSGVRAPQFESKPIDSVQVANNTIYQYLIQ